jgi:ribonuclease HI
VWALADPVIVEHMCLATEPSARQWLFLMLNTMDHAGFIRMTITMWAIWHARRKVIHEEIYQSPLATHLFVEAFIRDLGDSKQVMVKPRGGVAAATPRWIPPPLGCCKINVDGAVEKTRRRGSVGAVCRSQTGEYLGASAVVFDGITDPGCLEAMACRESLALAADLHIGEVMVASACAEMVQSLKGASMGRFSHITREIRETVQHRGGFSFRHEGRRSNEEAHTLARMATTLPVGRHVWLATLPEGLSFPVNSMIHDE